VTDKLSQVRLKGGPLHGEWRLFPRGEAPVKMYAVECPWGMGDAFHFAEARYDHRGRWIRTECRSVDGDPLVARRVVVSRLFGTRRPELWMVWRDIGYRTYGSWDEAIQGARLLADLQLKLPEHLLPLKEQT
jgi:hypothetical protein